LEGRQSLHRHPHERRIHRVELVLSIAFCVLLGGIGYLTSGILDAACLILLGVFLLVLRRLALVSPPSAWPQYNTGAGSGWGGYMWHAGGGFASDMLRIAQHTHYRYPRATPWILLALPLAMLTAVAFVPPSRLTASLGLIFLVWVGLAFALFGPKAHNRQ
jgi:quinol-cytochrome oxidoreductase complex cytochrome b subunit